MDLEKTNFKNARAVIDYLQLDGWRISVGSFYHHKKDGKICPEPGGQYTLERDRPYTAAAVKKYAKNFLKRRDLVDLLIERVEVIIELVAGDVSKKTELVKFFKEYRR